MRALSTITLLAALILPTGAFAEDGSLIYDGCHSLSDQPRWPSPILPAEEDWFIATHSNPFGGSDEREDDLQQSHGGPAGLEHRTRSQRRPGMEHGLASPDGRHAGGGFQPDRPGGQGAEPESLPRQGRARELLGHLVQALHDRNAGHASQLRQAP